MKTNSINLFGHKWEYEMPESFIQQNEIQKIIKVAFKNFDFSLRNGDVENGWLYNDETIKLSGKTWFLYNNFIIAKFFSEKVSYPEIITVSTTNEEVKNRFSGRLGKMFIWIQTTFKQ